MDPTDNLNLLRDALTASPDNITLRRHVGDLLLKRGLGAEAETLYRAGLELAPQSEELKLGLARAFQHLGKHAAALVIVEELLERPNAAAGTHMLHARLLMRRGDIPGAASAYRRAIALDATLADEGLAEVLGIESESAQWQPEEDDVDEMGRVRNPAGETGGGMNVEMERPSVNFDDVGGMEGVKEQIRIKIIEPMRRPEIYKAYGKAIGGGILMYGPPGCGKTHLARATAGQVNARFLSIGIHDVLDMWIGSSEQKLHALFENARKQSPTVLFFDEVDALGASRTDMRQSAGRQLINQFLSELDGVKSTNDGVLILAATNAPWHIDPAFRRPGRFDRVVFIPPPDAAGRASILRVLLKNKPVDNIDCEAIADKARDFSGADMKSVVDTAIEAKLTEALKTGSPQPLTTKDLLRAAKSVKPSTKEWFATARNYALYSNEAGIYDDILQYLKMK